MEKDPALRQGQQLLDKLCIAQQRIPGINDRFRFHPGYYLSGAQQEDQIAINGRHGIVLTLTEDPKIPVAQCGFDFENNDLVITNTPQGLTREKLCGVPEEKVSAVLRELKKGDFRSELLTAVIAIGKKFNAVGIVRIKGIAAEHHDKVDVNGGPLSLGLALKSMDTLFEKHDFTKDEMGDYYLNL